MARTLDVYILRNLIGQLMQDDYGDMSCKHDADWLDQPTAVPLSHSLPLRSEPFSRNKCRGYFAGILPEADNRRIIAKNLGISAKNDFAMLERIGSEYDPDKVIAKHFERFAQDATLGKAMVKRRVKEEVEAVLFTLATMPVDSHVAADIATLIRRRCEKTSVRIGA
jgi:serine/threonine-protein kinase HipA